MQHGGTGLAALSGVLTLSEAGVPVPVPGDLLLLLVGERAAAGRFPLWAALLAVQVVAVAGTTLLFFLCRGPAARMLKRFGPRVGLTEERVSRATDTLDRRGSPALAIGRAAPGLRTVTVVAAGTSRLDPTRALPALIAGATLFLQGHVLLGYGFGASAREVVDRAKGPAIAAVVALLVVGLIVWFVRRGRRGAAQAWSEACCPACLAISALSAPRAATNLSPPSPQAVDAR
jgi:membrane protein DedA with SNARE-associated domain